MDDEKKKKKLENSKIFLRSVVGSAKEVLASKLQGEYRQIVGEFIPYRELGFCDLHSFIQSIPDVVRIGSNREGELVYREVPTESTMHLMHLTKATKKRSTKAKPNYPPRGIHRVGGIKSTFGGGGIFGARGGIRPLFRGSIRPVTNVPRPMGGGGFRPALYRGGTRGKPYRPQTTYWRAPPSHGPIPHAYGGPAPPPRFPTPTHIEPLFQPMQIQIPSVQSSPEEKRTVKLVAPSQSVQTPSPSEQSELNTHHSSKPSEPSESPRTSRWIPRRHSPPTEGVSPTKSRSNTPIKPTEASSPRRRWPAFGSKFFTDAVRQATKQTTTSPRRSNYDAAKAAVQRMADVPPRYKRLMEQGADIADSILADTTPDETVESELEEGELEDSLNAEYVIVDKLEEDEEDDGTFGSSSIQSLTTNYRTVLLHHCQRWRSSPQYEIINGQHTYACMVKAMNNNYGSYGFYATPDEAKGVAARNACEALGLLKTGKKKKVPTATLR